MDKYQGQRMAPYFSTPLRLIDNEEFLKWLGTPDCKIWHIMLRYIIRAPMKNGMGRKIYENYYKNGKLAMYYKLDSIAKKAGMKSKGYISELIQNMIDRGYIKKHNDRWHGRSVIVYELGIHDKSTNHHETLHLHTEIIRKQAEKDIDKFVQGEPASSPTENPLYIE